VIAGPHAELLRSPHNHQKERTWPDLGMPHVDGRRVAREWKAFAPAMPAILPRLEGGTSMRLFGRAFPMWVLAMTTAGTACAQDAFHAPYWALNGVASIPLSSISRDKTSVGVAGRLGYRFNSILALELQGELVGRHGSGDALQNIVTVNARVFLPTERIQPYAVFGLGIALEPSGERHVSNSTAWRAGMGVQVSADADRGWFVEATCNRSTRYGSLLDTASIGAGLFFHW
jgi:hypothetical protein